MTKVVLWYSDIHKTHFMDDEAKEILASRGLDFAWEKIAELEITEEFEEYNNDPTTIDLQLCEYVFEQTNIGDLLSSQEHQNTIRNSVARHTSLSVSDIVEIVKENSSDFYMCATMGFDKVNSLVKKEVVQN